jgi:hypothetical protein
MVQYVNASPQRVESQRQLFSGLSQSLEDARQMALEQQQYQRNRGRLQQALGQVSDLAKQKATPLQTSLAFLNATAGIPGSERYVGQVLPLILQQAQAEASQKGFSELGGAPPQRVPAQGQAAQVARNAPPSLVTRSQPQNQTNNFFPTNLGPNEAPGNLPQAATEGLVRPVLNPQQMMQEAQKLFQAQKEFGLTFPQAYETVKGLNEDNRRFNESVEEERRARVSAQEEYGNRAVEKLEKVYPEATDEQRAIFKKLGEKAASEGQSQAEIDRYLAKEATKFKNTISNVQQSISAPRVLNEIQRKFLGTGRSFEQAAKDMQVKIKPLLELGLYDTARNLLNDLGYYPEERESIINPLSTQANALINAAPGVKKEIIVPPGKFDNFEQKLAPEQIASLKQNLGEILQKDPNASLVLLRKAFEDKGYDWASFKDAMNELVQSQEINLTDDQFNQLPYLDSPPLNKLESVLHSLKLIGR